MGVVKGILKMQLSIHRILRVVLGRDLDLGVACLFN